MEIFGMKLNLLLVRMKMTEKECSRSVRIRNAPLHREEKCNSFKSTRFQNAYHDPPLSHQPMALNPWLRKYPCEVGTGPEKISANIVRCASTAIGEYFRVFIVRDCLGFICFRVCFRDEEGWFPVVLGYLDFKLFFGVAYFFWLYTICVVSGWLKFDLRLISDPVCQCKRLRFFPGVAPKCGNRCDHKFILIPIGT